MTAFDLIRLQQRRTFLNRVGRGTGALALAAMLRPTLAHADVTTAAHYNGFVHPLHFAPKAKRVIWLGMAGGPSHLETFDYKPKLGEMAGKPMPESFTKGQPIAQLQGQQLRVLSAAVGISSDLANPAR